VMSERSERVHNAKTQVERWEAIRAFYRDAEAEIMAVETYQWGIDPYEVDWCRYFTPIEFGLWQDIRAEGAVLYPQYPIGPYFADFANPKVRVVIECDGKAFHQDKEKDRKRDKWMKDRGWSVYRLTGKECLKPDDGLDEEGNDVYVETEASGLVKMVCYIGCGQSRLR
jgi:very-short-patch-repair endonuclease